MRTSRVNTNLSAYANLFGNYGFNVHPLVPPRSKVVLHKKADERASWEYHGVKAWYVGPSLGHYRRLKCYVSSTQAVIDTGTAQTIPHIVAVPEFYDINAVQ